MYYGFVLCQNIFFRVFQTRRISGKRFALMPLEAVKDTQKDIPFYKIKLSLASSASFLYMV